MAPALPLLVLPLLASGTVTVPLVTLEPAAVWQDFQAEGPWDLSAASELVVLVKSHAAQTLGITLGGPGRTCGCKATFQVPASSSFQEVNIPLHRFAADPTERCNEALRAVAPCAPERLQLIRRLELWAKTPSGTAEVKSLLAQSLPLGSAPPKEYNGCKSPVQTQLRFNISSRKDPDVPVPVDPSETLADAVCCDKRTKVYAEPQFLYKEPDIALFKHLSSGVTTFYDSTCGVPLFKAPVNRSLADFKADTDEHGWPSFRKEEVFHEHVTVDKDNFVYSSCGTHLGSYLPDAQGPRYCMDLSCIAGNPAMIMV